MTRSVTAAAITGDYNHPDFVGGETDDQFSIGDAVNWHDAHPCTIVDFGSGKFAGIIQLKCNDTQTLILVDENHV